MTKGVKEKKLNSAFDSTKNVGINSRVGNGYEIKEDIIEKENLSSQMACCEIEKGTINLSSRGNDHNPNAINECCVVARKKKKKKKRKDQNSSSNPPDDKSKMIRRKEEAREENASDRMCISDRFHFVFALNQAKA